MGRALARPLKDPIKGSFGSLGIQKAQQSEWGFGVNSTTNIIRLYGTLRNYVGNY